MSVNSFEIMVTAETQTFRGQGMRFNEATGLYQLAHLVFPQNPDVIALSDIAAGDTGPALFMGTASFPAPATVEIKDEIYMLTSGGSASNLTTTRTDVYVGYALSGAVDSTEDYDLHFVKNPVWLPLQLMENANPQFGNNIHLNASLVNGANNKVRWQGLIPPGFPIRGKEQLQGVCIYYTSEDITGNFFCSLGLDAGNEGSSYGNSGLLAGTTVPAPEFTRHKTAHIRQFTSLFKHGTTVCVTLERLGSHALDTCPGIMYVDTQCFLML